MTEHTLSFWGKTRPASSDGAPEESVDWKPVLHHLLDVAAAALAIQHAAPARLAREAHMLDCAPEHLAAVSACLAGVHDLGKYSRAFQVKSPAHWPPVLGADRRAAPADHWRLTFALLVDRRVEVLPRMFPHLDPENLAAIAGAIAGHHGRPPSAENDRRHVIGGPNDFTVGDAALRAASEAAHLVWVALGEPTLVAPRGMRWATGFSWRLAGLTTLADWVGSDSEHFDFLDTSLPAGEYWPRAQAAADAAIVAKGLGGSQPAPFEGVGRLFPEIVEPRPLQRSTVAAALPDGPVLAILEDATGAGKTEAALTLAHRLIVAGRAEGLYFALPTMATANAMFERLKSDASDAAPYRRLFADDTRPSLALAHGAAALSEAFAAVKLAGRFASHGDDADGSAAAACAAWVADDRRKAFFAEIGAGTIDQALISVLPKRFLSLRQYGLAGKVLIVDEAHSYDAYMQRELERLLEFHAAAGGSAVVLSATLTAKSRSALEAAFHCGLSAMTQRGRREMRLMDEAMDRHKRRQAVKEAIEADKARRDAPYPLLTLCAAESRTVTPVAPALHTCRRVVVERVATADAALAAAREAAADGAAVAVIRNSVDDAISAYNALVAAGADATLFHARFAMVDRLAIERRAVEDFGKAGRRRAGRVLVATQVVEQSLDLDFDVMLTDLAPVDLLIQRAGRLWRHERGARPVAGPTLQVICPDWREADGEDWLAETQPKGRFVYPASTQWRSAAALFEAGSIDAPGGLRALLEAANGDRPVPEGLAANAIATEGQESADASLARLNLIDWENGYLGAAGVGEDQEVGTRLGREQVTLRLARLVEGAPHPWAWLDGSDPDDRRDWALSEVKIAARNGERLVSPYPTPGSWGRFDQDKILAVVGPDGRLALGEDISTYVYTYSQESGLERRVSDV